jgi:hypothetical protein
MDRGIQLTVKRAAFVSHVISFTRIRCCKFDVIVLNAPGDDDCANTKNCICDRTVMPIISILCIP